MKMHVSLVSDFSCPRTYKLTVTKSPTRKFCTSRNQKRKVWFFLLISNFKLVWLCCQVTYVNFNFCCLFLESSGNQTGEVLLWKWGMLASCTCGMNMSMMEHFSCNFREIGQSPGITWSGSTSNPFLSLSVLMVL